MIILFCEQSGTGLPRTAIFFFSGWRSIVGDQIPLWLRTSGGAVLIEGDGLFLVLTSCQMVLGRRSGPWKISGPKPNLPENAKRTAIVSISTFAVLYLYSIPLFFLLCDSFFLIFKLICFLVGYQSSSLFLRNHCYALL